MAKKFKVGHIRLLLNRLSEETRESLDHYGLGQISRKVGGSISRKYLYDSLVRPAERARNDEDKLSLAPNKMDELAQFLGYNNFNAFHEAQNMPADPILLSLPGSYYSYVRKNSERGMIFQSPVEIKRAGKRIYWLLKGPDASFEGEVKMEHGCIFCLMKSTGGKSFYHIYKIGRRKVPAVLKGTFSGVSTAFDPIAGRCVLTREIETFDKLVNQKLSVEEIRGSGNVKLRKLARYFEHYEQNNLRIEPPAGFDLDDLDGYEQWPEYRKL